MMMESTFGPYSLFLVAAGLVLLAPPFEDRPLPGLAPQDEVGMFGFETAGRSKAPHPEV